MIALDSGWVNFCRRFKSIIARRSQMSCIYYKNYEGSVEYSEEDQVFHGKIIGDHAFISYEGESLSALIEDFRISVDDYLEFCRERGSKPQLPVCTQSQ